jgi:hypothetical protein
MVYGKSYRLSIDNREVSAILDQKKLLMPPSIEK